MQRLFSVCVAIYIVFYVFEGVIRYGFNLAGHDELIFARDIILGAPLIVIFLQQLFQKKIHPAFFIYFFIVIFHGAIIYLNFGVWAPVFYGVKMLITPLAGAIAARALMKPSRAFVICMLVLWLASFSGIVLDKYFVQFPWQGMNINIGDIKVDISRDWQITGEDKRAGGFMRSSIHAANIVPLMTFLLAFNLPGWLSLSVLGAAVPLLFWTTQKGSLLAYLLVLGCMCVMPKRPIPLLRAGVAVMTLLCILLPAMLPGYTMPHDSGVFSMSSFYQRIEEMWPQAWRWIDAHEIFPFGVGMGGIGGAMRLYSLPDVNAADNVFILMYAYFGIFAFLYLGYIAFAALRARDDGNRHTTNALASLMFLMGYGCVISLLEDQMASLFLGACLGWLYEVRREQKAALPTASIAPL